MMIDIDARTLRTITGHWIQMPKKLAHPIAAIRASVKSTVVQLSNFVFFVYSIPLSSWLCLCKHIHNDHIAGLVVHHKVEHVSSNLVGFEVHGVIALVEQICAVF